MILYMATFSDLSYIQIIVSVVLSH